MRKVFKRVAAMFAMLVLVSGGSLLVTAAPAQAVGEYDNADIADKALLYMNQSGTVACRDAGKTGGDQCKQFVNCIVFMASDGNQWPVPGYNAGFQNAGGVEVTANSAVKGDIIQVGDSDTANPLHTAIVFQNLGSGTFNVVDSNWNYSGKVAQHNWTPPSGARFWRMGTVGGVLPAQRYSGGGNASTREVGAIDLFVRGTNGGANMYHNFTDNGPWSGWFPVDNSGTFNITSAPAAVSWAPDRIDVFARDTNGALAHKAYAYGSWHQWETLGGCIIGAPTVTSWGPGRLDVFAQSCNTTGPNLWHKFWFNNQWYEEMVPVTTMRITSPPSATAWGDGRIDLFARGESGDLLHKWFVNNAWGDWTSKGGCIIGAPAVSSWAYGRLDVFARNCNTSGNNVDHTYYESGSWSSEPLPGNENLFVLDLSGAVSWGSGRIDIFGRNASGEAIHKWFASNWYNWQSLGGAVLP